jgi:ABC-type transport system involved in multi-copper enzyme maturation permease subunit
MIFLPLVERELRVASRRKSTFWIRCGAAMIGILFMLPALTMAALGQGRSNAGAYVFMWMSWYGMIGGMVAGAFLGADCIAEERREGTLGFLFLTDLKSIDVVLGKFAGVSLNAFYGALAMAPLLGASILAGGVTGGEFWRTTLALLNMLFFATSLSIFISARAKANSRPTTLALTVMILIWVGGGAAQSFAKNIPWPTTSRILFWTSLASPGETFSFASDASHLFRPADFWE